jgi:hypothetical protein
MKKKKPKYKAWSSAQHPAALAAESDGVKLLKELEALRKQQAELDQRNAESNDAIRAANIERNMICKRHQEKLEMNLRLRRVLDVQITNVEELLSKVIYPQDERLMGCVLKTA